METRIHIHKDVYGPAVARAQNFLRYARSAFTGEPILFPRPKDTAILYAHFMHDIQRTGPGETINADFMVIRSMEKPTA